MNRSSKDPVAQLKAKDRKIQYLQKEVEKLSKENERLRTAYSDANKEATAFRGSVSDVEELKKMYEDSIAEMNAMKASYKDIIQRAMLTEREFASEFKVQLDRIKKQNGR